jgi:hypothetical protein
MALEKALRPLASTLVRKVGEQAARGKPFYSPVDQAIANITQGKGTSAQMLAELLKTKGVAKELKDRPAIKKALEQPKITKQELERVAAENPAPQVEETVLGSRGKLLTQDDIDRLEAEARRTRNWTAYEDAVQRYEAQQLGRGGEEIGEQTKFAQYTIPGGENYREVLIRLPLDQSSAKVNQLTERANQLDQQAMSAWTQHNNAEEFNRLSQEAKDLRRQATALEKASSNKTDPYRSSHFEEPNILAHARVSDRVGPNGEKILHIEEIQSDWHQAARDMRKRKIDEVMRTQGIDRAAASKLVPEDYGYRSERIESRLKESEEEMRQIGLQIRGINNRMMHLTDSDMDEFNRLADQRQALYERQGFLTDEGNLLLDQRYESVPDAPFKQNWHELVMKRLLDDAARNGYDKVVLTPGAEQAKRYDLSKHVNKVVWNEKTGTLAAQRAGGDTGTLEYENVTAAKLADYIGKDAAEKLTNATDHYGWRSIEGEDLQVGGEGMKGFYDQILPSYLNEYGKKYGARVGTYDMPSPKGSLSITDLQRERGMTEQQWLDLTPDDRMRMIDEYEVEAKANRIPMHSFDITPQMREDIVGRGMPLYQVAPPVAIGAGAAMQEEPAEYAGGGAIRKAAKALLPKGQQAILPAAESAANLERFLAESKAPMRLYHGTMATEGGKGQEAIRRIKPSKEGSLGSGVYLTPSSAHASAYSGSPNQEAIEAMLANKYHADTGLQFLRNQQTGTVLESQVGGNMLPVYAKLKNPLVLEGNGDPMVEALTKLGMDQESAARMVERAYENKGYIGKEVETRARAAGYDGLMQYRDGDLSEVVSYNPSAVKSAIGNRGSYDVTDPDINKAGGGLIKKAAKALLPKGQQAVLPAAESATNLEKFLEGSAAKKRLYHGTSKDFDAFSHKHMYSGEGGSHSGSGFYFTDNPESASHFAGMKGESGANVRPVYLSVKKPLKFDWAQGETTGADITLTPSQVRSIMLEHPEIKNPDESPLTNWGDIRGSGFNKTLNDAVKSYAGSSMLAALRNDFFGNDYERWLKALNKATGYDSGMTTTPAGDTHYIAWFPEQIKSAIGNRGTYDINEADINKAKGGQVSKDTMWMAVQNKQLRKKHGN